MYRAYLSLIINHNIVAFNYLQHIIHQCRAGPSKIFWLDLGKFGWIWAKFSWIWAKLKAKFEQK